MSRYADLEISLHGQEAGFYAIEIRFNLPDDAADESDEVGHVQFDFNRLLKLAVDPPGYGKALTEMLFADQPAQDRWLEAKARAQSQNPPLGMRVRLSVGQGDVELHPLRWELLCDPKTNTPIATNENTPFSRYLSSLDWSTVRLRPKGQLKATVVIANPSDLADYQQAPIDTALELQAARTSLGAIPVETPPHATLNEIIDSLRSGQPDILYLVAHGTLKQGEPCMLLENEQGLVGRVTGSELITRLTELTERPRLVVLASCQSAGSGEGELLSALGPRLAEVGIPAVLAMQGNIDGTTVARFMPRFFQELQVDGQIDRAMGVARGEVRDCLDYWMPALFTRLKNGRIWYEPGFSSSAGGAGGDFDYWESLKVFIRGETCTPIIGPGLTETWLGQPAEIARRWAVKNGYPFAPYEQEDLPRIAQYIARANGVMFLRAAFCEALRDELTRRCVSALPDDLVKARVWTPANVLAALQLAATQSCSGGSDQLHRQLAELHLPIYITTSPGNLLANALEKAGASPQVRLCPWWSQSIPEKLWRYEDEPTPEKPLVYHLYGHLGTPESVVLSEDNYFDFLIGITLNKRMIPDTIRNALTNSALLFLGFRVEDWSFRVLFRMLMAQEGSEQLKEYTHVTAQVEPEEGRLIDTQRAHRYLERVFSRDRIGIYWGRSEEFLNELTQQLR